MKDPAFLFYSSDFLTGTMFMTNEQVGLYIRLLCAQHQHGGRIDTNVLRSMCDSITNGIQVFNKFKHDDKGSYSERLDEEMQKRALKSIKASESVKKRWENEKINNKKTNYERNTNVIRYENVNVNENVNKNTSEYFSLLLSFLESEVNKIHPLKASKSRAFHGAIFDLLTSSGYNCAYEYSIPGGRIDILVFLNDGINVAIEIDNRTPRAKNIMKIEGMDMLVVSILRNPYFDKSYKQFNVDGIILYNPNQIDKNDIKFDFFKSLILSGANENLASEWMQVRKSKKATNTETALKSFLAQVAKSGKDINEVLEICITRDWKGFSAEWVKPDAIVHTMPESSVTGLKSRPEMIFDTAMRAAENLKQQLKENGYTGLGAGAISQKSDTESEG